jgi:hypothetical protein
MTTVPQTIRNKIAAAADDRCEYCQTDQKVSGAQMHVEHIVPLSRGGCSAESNLCLACAWCNSFKGSKVEAVDPETNQVSPLFNPRLQLWHEHFQWSQSGLHIIGLTAVGRATVLALKMNNEYIIPARRHWVEAGWHPPGTS